MLFLPTHALTNTYAGSIALSHSRRHIVYTIGSVSVDYHVDTYARQWSDPNRVPWAVHAREATEPCAEGMRTW